MKKEDFKLYQQRYQKENKTFTIINYGCQMNESDSEHYAGQLKKLGYTFTEDYHNTDLVVINTCCVRETAEKKIYGKIGEFKNIKEANPGMIICVVGCMAQKDGENILHTYPYVDLILGTSYINNLKEILENYIQAENPKIVARINDDEVLRPSEFEGEFSRNSTYSAWVPIMYGCNNFCTYCIVPYVRGRERSREKKDILNEIKNAIKNNYKEVTLLGQNVNSYGNDLGEKDAFAALLKEIAALPGLKRLRFMTSHPHDMSDELIRTVAENKIICQHFHVPVQSGSTRIMKKMNRGYTRESYLELIKKIKKLCPNASITTDIIVGFPGETEEDFAETISLVKEVEYNASYTFIYSKRTGTPAATFKDQVPENIKKERLNRLMLVQNEISNRKHEKFVNKVVQVMVDGESTNDSNVMSGRTEGNELVLWPKEEHSFTPGDIVNIKITKSQTWLLKGIYQS
jgi:tRNA-2-methylthio-N6-dimethylallyladenosine synthase